MFKVLSIGISTVAGIGTDKGFVTAIAGWIKDYAGMYLSPWFPVLLIAILIIVSIYTSRIYRRFPQWLTSFKAMLAIIGFKRQIDQETLDKVIATAGYSYDPKQEIFYSNMNAWQRKLGYCRLYDESAASLGMIIDCEPIYFTYGGKRWLIEFWKGQYDLTTGCEIGVYTTGGFDLNIPSVFKGPFYHAATNEELLQMSLSLKRNGKTLLTRTEKHWWLTGFRLGEFSEPSELTMDIEIILKDAAMRDAFVKGLKNAGYSDDEITVNGNTVGLRFDKPRTEQPTTRTTETDRIIQWKNKLLCDKYRDITDPYDNLLDKINAILEQAPDLINETINMGKPKHLFGEYKEINSYLVGASKRGSLRQVSQVFERAEEILFDDSSRIVLMSDIHRGDGSWADDFARNQNIYFAALTHYYNNNYTYIEIGDGDELWENNKLSDIVHAHRDVFLLLSKFFYEGRLHFIFGNHDMVKGNYRFVENNLFQYFDEREKKFIPLFENIKPHEGLVLRHKATDNKVFLLHGHQVDCLNYNLWKLSRFLVRYLWRPLNFFGVNDPTSTAKNYRKKAAVEKKLIQWVMREKHMLISGHTHRPMFPDVGEPPYFNGGSSVHPRGITGIEIADGYITLVAWNVKTKYDGQLFINREVIAKPRKIRDYFNIQ